MFRIPNYTSFVFIAIETAAYLPDLGGDLKSGTMLTLIFLACNNCAKNGGAFAARGRPFH